MSQRPLPSIDETLAALPRILDELTALKAQNVKLLERLEANAYDAEKLRTIPGTAEYMGTTEGALKALIKRGELNSVQIGNALYVSQSAIREWIERSHKAQDNARYKRELQKT